MLGWASAPILKVEKMIVLGVDPGKSGALAFYNSDEDTVDVFDMPLVNGEVHAAGIARLIQMAKPKCAIIERVHAMPKNGAVPMFKTGIVI